MFTKRDNISIILLFIAAVIFFSPVLFTGKIYFLRDITYIFHPWKTLCSELVSKGEFPLWNPYAYCGMPLMANWQSSVFYPFTLLFYFLPFSLALKLYYLLHLFIAGLFAYLFGRSLKLSRAASSGMMILFAFNGFLISKLEFLSHAGSDVWTFALLLFIRNPLLLASAIAINFMCGYQMFLCQIFILLTFVFVGNIKTNTKNVLYAGALSVGIVAVQLLPTMELMSLSNRIQSGIDSSIAMLHSLKPSGLIRLISPYLNHYSEELVTGEKFQWTTTMYVGISSMTAIALGFIRLKVSRMIVWAGILIILGILLAFGSSTPVYPWLQENIFVFRSMRYPAPFVFLSIVGLTILLGMSLNSLRYKVILVFLIAAELLIIGFNFQPTATAGFFQKKPEIAKSIKRNRFILSPGTEKNRYLKGKDISDAWQQSRSYLYNLTCMPYHLYNAYGTGDPLTLPSIENFVDEAYRQPTAQASLPFFRDLGVEYLLCRNQLPDSDGYKLTDNGPPYVYQIEKPVSLFESNGNVEILTNKPGKTVIDVNSNSAGNFVWKEIYYPGWQVFVNGVIVPVKGWKNIFRQWTIPSGESSIVMTYRPLSFRIGVIVTIISIMLLVVLGYRRLSL